LRATRECLTWAATYLALVRAFVRDELARGRDGSAVAESATYERFVGDRIAPDRHGMIKRHRGVVEKIVQEEMLHERTGD
jgi:hypothetical protein